MNNKSKFGTLTLAALLVVAGLSLASCGREVQAVPEMPPALNNRVEFHLSQTKGKEEKVRLVQYSPTDGKTKIGMLIEYQTGNTAHVSFRANGPAAGTIETVKVEYPLQPGQTKRLTARELKLDVDGKTAVSDRVYRENGVLRYAADRKSENSFEAFEYQDDGITSQRHQVFLKVYGTWKLDTEEAFRKDGGLDTSLSRRDDGSVITKKFNDENKLEWRSVLNSWGGGRVTDYYDKDGTTNTKRVEQTSYDVTTTVYKQGKPSSQMRFSSAYSSVDVNEYDDNGKVRLVQSWTAKSYGDVRTNGSIDPSKYRLSSIEYKDVNGFTYKSVSFYRDGSGTPETIRLRDASKPGGWYYYPYTEKKFNQDGTLSNITEYDSHGAVVRKEDHTAAENIREALDANDLAMPGFEQPPELLKYQYQPYPNW